MKEFVTRNGEKVSIGDNFVKMLETPVGPVPVEIITVNESTIPILLKEGVIVENTLVEKKEVAEPTNIEFYIEHLAARIAWNKFNLGKYLNNLHNIYPAAALSIVLREVAIVLDEKYPDHIRNSKEIWVISMTDGRIHKLHDLSRVKNFNNFAAFRTVGDAIFARAVLKEAFNELFGSGRK